MKDSSGDWQHVQELLAVCSPGFAIGQGDETQMARSLEHGADAIVPGIGNLIPEVCVELVTACRSGEVQRASAAKAAIDSARRMYERVYWLTALKAALSLKGPGRRRLAAVRQRPRRVQATARTFTRNPRRRAARARVPRR